eukprot:CFRG6006T1
MLKTDYLYTTSEGFKEERAVVMVFLSLCRERADVIDNASSKYRTSSEISYYCGWQNSTTNRAMGIYVPSVNV